MTSHQKFKKAAGLMLVAVMASRLLGVIREMLIARQFGQTGAVSAYTSAFNIPDLLYFFLSSGALSSAFIPEFTKRFETGKQKEAWQVFSIIGCLMGLVLTVAIVFAWIFARPLAAMLSVPGFVKSDPQLVQLTVVLTRIILPCQLFFFVGGLMMATLQSRQEFRATAAGPVIYNIGIIFGALVLSKWFHIRGLAIGTLIGAFAGNVVYTYYWMRKLGFEFHPSLNIRHPGVIRVAQLALPVIFGLGLPQIDVIINKWFASFVSPQAPAALNYANRLMQAPLGIFAQAAGTAILPMLAAYAAKNAIDDMRSGVAYGVRAIMVESIPATVFMVVMADPLVRMIYMSGQFTSASVPATVIPLIWYSVGIYAWAGQAIVARGFFALQDTITPVVVGTVSTIVFIPLNYILMRTMGTGGIALATTIAISLHFFGLSWFLCRRLNGIEGGSILKTVGRIIVAAAVMGFVCFGVRLGMARAIGSWQLQDGDIRNPAALGAKLHQSKTPISEFVYGTLTSKTHGMIAASEDADRLRHVLEKALVTDLNQIISGSSLYNSRRFANVTLIGETKSLADNSDNISGSRELIRLNRGLLDAAFSGSIVRVADKSFVDKLFGIGEKRVTAGPSLAFIPSDFRDLQLLATDLEDKDNPVSAYVISQLPGSTREMLRDYLAKCDASKDLPYSLMHDINVAIRTDRLYSASRFADIRLSPSVVSLAEIASTGKRLSEANRLLLEAAYSNEIVRRPVDRVEGKMGSALTVLVALILGGGLYLGLLRVLKVDELDYLWGGLRRRIFKRPGAGGGGPENPAVVEPVAPDEHLE